MKIFVIGIPEIKNKNGL